MFKIFKEFLPLKEIYGNDQFALWLNVIGGALIGITFLVVGIMCTAMARIGDGAAKKRVILTKMFGYFLISCSLSRFITVLCTWHDLAILDGWIKMLTGLLATIAIIYLPSAIKESISHRILEKTAQSLEETKKDILELKKIYNKVSEEGDQI